MTEVARNLDHWELVESFTLKEAALLWVGEDPLEPETWSKRSQPVLQRLVTAADRNELKADPARWHEADRGEGEDPHYWPVYDETSRVARQELAAWAQWQKFVPKFLERTVASLPTPEEVLAQVMTKWGTKGHLTVTEAACLWAGLDPYAVRSYHRATVEEIAKTLVDAIHEGVLKAQVPHKVGYHVKYGNPGIFEAVVERAELAAWARGREDRPAFLQGAIERLGSRPELTAPDPEAHASKAGTGNSPSFDDELWTSKETAKYLNLSEQTLRDWRSTGLGPPELRWTTVGTRSIRYFSSSVREYLAANSSGSAPRPR